MKRNAAIAAGAVSTWLVAVAAWIGIGPAEASRQPRDVAIVLGAAVDGDRPSPVFAARIAHAIALQRANRVGHILFTGGRSVGDRLSEAEVGRDMARRAGVPDARILVDRRSRTTRANLIEASRLMREVRLTSAVVVSDPLHLRRAMVMAGDLALDAQASAAPDTRYRTWRSKVPFLVRETYFMHHYWLFGE